MAPPAITQTHVFGSHISRIHELNSRWVEEGVDVDNSMGQTSTSFSRIAFLVRFNAGSQPVS
jgi:hypothetical protein